MSSWFQKALDAWFQPITKEEIIIHYEWMNYFQYSQKIFIIVFHLTALLSFTRSGNVEMPYFEIFLPLKYQVRICQNHPDFLLQISLEMFVLFFKLIKVCNDTLQTKYSWNDWKLLGGYFSSRMRILDMNFQGFIFRKSLVKS